MRHPPLPSHTRHSWTSTCSRTFALTASCIVEDSASLDPEHDDRRIAHSPTLFKFLVSRKHRTSRRGCASPSLFRVLLSSRYDCTRPGFQRRGQLRQVHHMSRSQSRPSPVRRSRLTPSPLLMGIPHMPTYLDRETFSLRARRRGSRTSTSFPISSTRHPGDNHAHLTRSFDAYHRLSRERLEGRADSPSARARRIPVHSTASILWPPLSVAVLNMREHPALEDHEVEADRLISNAHSIQRPQEVEQTRRRLFVGDWSAMLHFEYRCRWAIVASLSCSMESLQARQEQLDCLGTYIIDPA